MTLSISQLSEIDIPILVGSFSGVIDGLLLPIPLLLLVGDLRRRLGGGAYFFEAALVGNLAFLTVVAGPFAVALDVCKHVVYRPGSSGRPRGPEVEWDDSGRTFCFRRWHSVQAERTFCASLGGVSLSSMAPSQ